MMNQCRCAMPTSEFFLEAQFFNKTTGTGQSRFQTKISIKSEIMD